MKKIELAKKPSRKHWREKLDKLFSAVIKQRSKKCLRCGRTENLNAAHIYSKGKYTRMRFDTENAILLCWNCHLNWAHKNPLEFTEWLYRTLLPERLARLKLRAQVIDKSLIDYKAIELFLKEEIKKYGDGN